MWYICTTKSLTQCKKRVKVIFKCNKIFSLEKEINDRLLKFIYDSGFNVNTFSNKIGVNPAVIHNIVKGRKTKPSYEVLKKIGLSFDNIDLHWLITGESKKISTLEEDRANYNSASDKQVNRRVDELTKIVEEIASEIKGLKGRKG